MTAASPVDRWFGGRLLSDTAQDGVAALDHHGVRHVFEPPSSQGQYALDLERRDATLAAELAAALTRIDPEMHPLLTWTRLEVLAKITGIPVHLILRDPARARPAANEVVIRQPVHPRYWITIGWQHSDLRKNPEPGSAGTARKRHPFD
ncbi:hypothetical protein [Roseovarius sp.]|uniref:hypothetical protein n=1 Tax=Roseovarius sp. TaxID=1486281 RepID=UPI0035699E45